MSLTMERLIMTYPLCFSPDFFLPCDKEETSLSPSPHPTTLLEALERQRRTEPAWWEELARQVFGCEARVLDAERVLEHALEVNACAGYVTPVQVFLDEEMAWSVEVYDPAQSLLSCSA